MRVGCCCGNFERAAETKKGKEWKSRFLSSVVALFLNNKPSIVFFFLSPDGVSVDFILVIFYLSFSLARSLAPSTPLFPKRRLRSCMCNHSVTSLEAAFVARVRVPLFLSPSLCVCVCVGATVWHSMCAIGGSAGGCRRA